MKRAFLWITVAALVVLGAAMIVSAFGVPQMYSPTRAPIVLEHDPKLHKMLEDEQLREQHEELKIELEYLSVAALEFTLAAFLAGKARRAR